MVAEAPQHRVHTEAEQQVGDDVLQEHDRGVEAGERLELGVDEQPHQFVGVATHGRLDAAHGRVDHTARGESLQRVDRADFCEGIGVLVRIGHPREELEPRVPVGIAPYPTGDLGDGVVRGAHERLQAGVIGVIQHRHDRIRVAELHGLGPRLVLRHVVDPEELIVPEQQTIHHDLPAIDEIRSTTQSVAYALRNETSGTASPWCTDRTKVSTCVEYSSPRR